MPSSFDSVNLKIHITQICVSSILSKSLDGLYQLSQRTSAVCGFQELKVQNPEGHSRCSSRRCPFSNISAQRPEIGDLSWRPISHSNWPKLLGVTFDNMYTFSEHAKAVANRVQSLNNVLKVLAGVPGASLRIL